MTISKGGPASEQHQAEQEADRYPPKRGDLTFSSDKQMKGRSGRGRRRSPVGNSAVLTRDWVLKTGGESWQTGKGWEPLLRKETWGPRRNKSELTRRQWGGNTYVCALCLLAYMFVVYSAVSFICAIFILQEEGKIQTSKMLVKDHEAIEESGWKLNRVFYLAHF